MDVVHIVYIRNKVKLVESFGCFEFVFFSFHFPHSPFIVLMQLDFIRVSFSSIFFLVLLPQQHKTTLGEAEIQSAVEAAAVIFKKVVLQRRQAAKKANEEGKLIF